MTVINPGEWASPTPPGGHDMPSPFHGDRLKTLRTERGWSQADLADKIGSDARQVSRYENGRVAPSLDVLAKIADTLDISLDYLVIDTAPRRALRAPENALSDQLTDFATLDPDDQAALLKVLDALVTKTKLRAITG